MYAGRWVRWFGASGAVTSAPGPRPPGVSQASEGLTVPAGAGIQTASAPTGVMSVEQLPAQMLTGILVEEGTISRRDEHLALQEHYERGVAVEEVLCEKNLVSEMEMVSILSQRCHVPHLSLTRHHVKPEVLDLVPAEFARANRIFPLDRLGKVLNVAMSNPLDQGALRKLETETGLRLKVVVASPRELSECIDKHYPPPEEERPEPVAEEVLESAPSTREILVDSIRGLLRKRGQERVAWEDVLSAAPAPSAEATVPAAPGPAGEPALSLSDEEARAFTRASSGLLYRAWAAVLGHRLNEPLHAEPVAAPEFGIVAAAEPMERREPPASAPEDAAGGEAEGAPSASKGRKPAASAASRKKAAKKAGKAKRRKKSGG